MRGRDALQNLKKELFNPYFSHIYVEKEAVNSPNTKKILSNFKESKIVYIDHYKDVFCRTHQNYNLQKKSSKLIIAVKKDNLLYKGAKVCEDFGNEYFYYTSTMMNCIYDCEYCYLQGMYSSSNIVVFVNIEDIFREVEKLLKSHSVYLCISYDTDILAFENIVGYGRKWIEFAKVHPNLKIELRTKSTNFNSIEDIRAIENVILAWTVSPDRVIKNYENRTPSLKERLETIKKAIDKGWKVRICFDPMLYIKDWKKIYKDLFEYTFNRVDVDKIYDVSIGVFRISKDYLKTMRRQRFDSVIVNYPFETVKGVCSYKDTLSKEMINYAYNTVKEYVEEEKIYI